MRRSKPAKENAFTLIELAGAVIIMLIITVCIIEQHNFAVSDITTLKNTDGTQALNQAETDLADYCANVQPNKPGAAPVTADPDFTSTVPATREAMLLRNNFLARAINTTGFSISTNNNQIWWSSP